MDGIRVTEELVDELTAGGTKYSAALDWDGSPITWDYCNIAPDGHVIDTPRDCETCRFRALNQAWGCCLR